MTTSTTSPAAGSPKPCVSFEFFPPKSEEAQHKFQLARATLAAAQPAYFSVTYGAGGTTKSNTLETVFDTMKVTGIETVPHLSCIGDNREHLLELLTLYKAKGVRKIVALRGDLPSGMGLLKGEFSYARDLIAFIRETTGDYFHLEVAAYPEMHPQGGQFHLDFQHFVEKIDAGANGAITQYFYNIDAYEHFMNMCAQKNITVPIVPGIMPITNYSRLARFSQMCGAEIPRWLEKQLLSYGDDIQSIRQFGEEAVTRLTEKLISLGAPGLHFYTLNQAKPSLAICQNLKLGSLNVNTP